MTRTRALGRIAEVDADGLRILDDRSPHIALLEKGNEALVDDAARL